jgi:hypothetical protein
LHALKQPMPPSILLFYEAYSCAFKLSSIFPYY